MLLSARAARRLTSPTIGVISRSRRFDGFDVALRISRGKPENNLEIISKLAVNGPVNWSFRGCIGPLPRVNEHLGVRGRESIFGRLMHWENDTEGVPELA